MWNQEQELCDIFKLKLLFSLISRPTEGIGLRHTCINISGNKFIPIILHTQLNELTQNTLPAACVPLKGVFSNI